MVPGDFNGDAQLDLLLCRDAGNEQVKLEVWWGNGNNLSMFKNHYSWFIILYV